VPQADVARRVAEAFRYARESAEPVAAEAAMHLFAGGNLMSERTLTIAAAISEAIAQAMAADERVFVLGKDVGRYGGIFGATGGLFERFGPERVRDTPISETAFIGAALGAAAEGQRPIDELRCSRRADSLQPRAGAGGDPAGAAPGAGGTRHARRGLRAPRLRHRRCLSCVWTLRHGARSKTTRRRCSPSGPSAPATP
jgi:hypothetical protein